MDNLTLFKNVREATGAIEFVEQQLEELSEKSHSLSWLQQHAMDCIINSVFEVEDYTKYCKNYVGVSGFAVDEAFEAVYYSESYEQAEKKLKRLKSLVALEMQKEAGDIR